MLPFTGAVLISLYRDAVERSFDARLNQYLEYLIAVTSPDEGLDIAEPTAMGEPLFSLPFSGWYWEIKAIGEQSILFKSDSLVSEALGLPSDKGVTPDATEIRKAYLTGPERQTLRVLEREIAITEKEQQKRYIYAMAGDASEIENEVDAFAMMLAVAFCMLGAGLLIATFFQVRFGLRPLNEIRDRLQAIRSGKAALLEGSPPEEIQPLQEELNALIQSNQDIIERARTHVGNLAHALKTPISVLTNEARDAPGHLSEKVKEQVEVMRDQVNLYLDRARRAARAQSIGAVTEVESVLQSLGRTLERINRDKGVAITIASEPGLKFRGERQDLEEIVGNLMDNACKWCKSKVEARGRLLPTPGEDGRRWLDIEVDDDGPGLRPEQRATALKRGQRLDESKPGSGLGLNIVTETAAMYGGRVELDDAKLGGLRVRLRLPAVG